MPGLGTIINVVSVIIAGLLGILLGKFLKPRIQQTLINSNGVCVIFIGILGVIKESASIVNHHIEVNGIMMLIVSMSLGSLLGEIIDIDKRVEKFGAWLKIKTGNEKDSEFINAFVTASLTVCIGAMAIVGAINDSLLLDPSVLISKSILDVITIMVMTASLGKGCMFAFIPIGIFQGLVTLLARVFKPIMTDTALSNMNLVGSVLIFCVGLNLIRTKKIRVANMLPALIFAVIWAFLPI